MLYWRDIWRFGLFMLAMIGFEFVYFLVTGKQADPHNDVLLCVSAVILCAIREKR